MVDMNKNNILTCAIIVTFEPDKIRLDALIDSLLTQVESIVIVDNASTVQAMSEFTRGNNKKISIIALEENCGVATAQNRGIKWATQKGFSYVLLMDQDSLPETSMVKHLFAGMKQKTEEGFKVAAVGPQYTDIKGQNASPFVKLEGSELCRIDCVENEIVSVDILISSGCLISIEALTSVGGMTNLLFIDYVDTEWCLRAAYKGYALFGIGAAHMQHDLGDEFTQLFGRTFPVHSSVRNYYIIRNGLWLLRQPWVSSAWQIMDLGRLFKIYLVYSLYAGTRYMNWKMMNKGIWHSLLGKMGKLDE